MYKNGVLTMEGFNNGQESHPISGFGLLKNVEVFENKGLAKLKQKSTLSLAVTPTQLPIARLDDIYGNEYVATGVTGSGTIYKNGVAIASGIGKVRDMKIYGDPDGGTVGEDYLFVRYGENLGIYGPLNGSPQWFSGGSTYNGSYNAQIVIGQDDFIYITDGNQVLKKEVTASGVPGVEPTVVTAATLNLPDSQFATCLTEYGTKIVIGTQGGGSYFERGDTPTARLYSWNRQAGTLGNPGLADLPINFNENGINAIIQYANKLYVSAGTAGNIYVTDSTNYVKLATLPYTSTAGNSVSTVYTNAMDISSRGTLLVGLSCERDDFSRPGVYEIDIDTAGSPLAFSTVSDTSGSVGKIGFVDSVGGNSHPILKTGWSTSTTYGMDTTSGDHYESFGGVIEGALEKVGISSKKKTFQHVEWTLADPLVEGQDIRISARKDSKSAYTLIGTWGHTADTGIVGVGAVTSFEDTGALADAVYAQIKVELNQDASVSDVENVNLISVTLW